MYFYYYKKSNLNKVQSIINCMKHRKQIKSNPKEFLLLEMVQFKVNVPNPDVKKAFDSVS